MDYGACKSTEWIMVPATMPDDFNLNLHKRRKVPDPVTASLTTIQVL